MVSPTAVASVLMELARDTLLPYSTSAAPAGLRASPTPTPWKIRPTNSHPTSGASAKISTPKAIDPSPASIVARRPM